MVRVDPRDFEGWWYEGGGIYRHVRLVSLAPTHVAPWGVDVVAEVKDPRDGIQAPAELTITTALANDSDVETRATLVNEIVDADGIVAATARTTQRIAAKASVDVRQPVSLAEAKAVVVRAPLFVSDPQQRHRARKKRWTRSPRPSECARFVLTPTGDFSKRQAAQIQGVCNHRDFAGVGVALPSHLRMRVRTLKEMGAKAWRCSHHKKASELLDASDRLGMLS